jgi:hypothetical protein
MKRFLFSAVALIGFTVASYGANQEKLLVENIVLASEDCVEQWERDVRVLMEHYEATFEEADRIATRNFEACLDYYYPLD